MDAGEHRNDTEEQLGVRFLDIAHGFQDGVNARHHHGLFRPPGILDLTGFGLKLTT